MRRVFATKLFCLLKAAETGDTSWIIKDLGIEALLIPFFFSQFNIPVELAGLVELEREGPGVFFTPPQVKIQSIPADQLRTLLKSTFPQEYEYLEQTYRKSVEILYARVRKQGSTGLNLKTLPSFLFLNMPNQACFEVDEELLQAFKTWCKNNRFKLKEGFALALKTLLSSPQTPPPDPFSEKSLERLEVEAEIKQIRNELRGLQYLVRHALGSSNQQPASLNPTPQQRAR
jgi:hypothetical protein